MRVRAICRKIGICRTSLVLRVIREGEPKWLISRAEKAITRLKLASRRPRPTPIETLDANWTAITATVRWTSVRPSTTAPVSRR